MIAAARRWLAAMRRWTAKRLRVALAPAGRSMRNAGRGAKRLLLKARPPIQRQARRVGNLAIRALRWAGRRIRPPASLFFHGMALGERWLRRVGGLAGRAMRRAAAWLTLRRAAAGLILFSAAGLLVSQFLDYRAVEIGQPGYAGLPAATPPTVGAQPAGWAHSYLLAAPALLAAALAGLALRRNRPRLGRLVFVLGLVSLAVVLLADLPAGLDAGSESSRFAGAHAILLGGFWLELASALGLILGGLLLAAAPKLAARYHARPCRIRISSFAKGASALRRRRRHPASRPGRAARRASRRRSGGASAPASPP